MSNSEETVTIEKSIEEYEKEVVANIRAAESELKKWMDELREVWSYRGAGFPKVAFHSIGGKVFSREWIYKNRSKEPTNERRGSATGGAFPPK